MIARLRSASASPVAWSPLSAGALSISSTYCWFSLFSSASRTCSSSDSYCLSSLRSSLESWVWVRATICSSSLQCVRESFDIVRAREFRELDFAQCPAEFCALRNIARSRSRTEQPDLGFRHLPCAPERLEQTDRRLQPRQPNLRQLILSLEQCALRVERRQQVVGSFAVADFREPERQTRLFHDLFLKQLLLCRAPPGGQRAFDVRERGEDELAVVLDQFALARCRHIDLRAQAAAVENRLQQRGAKRQCRGGRAEEIEQHIARESRRSRELDSGQQCSARRGDVGIGGGKLRLGAGEIGPAGEQVRGKSGSDARHGERGHGQARSFEALGRPAGQYRERVQRLALLQFERRN